MEYALSPNNIMAPILDQFGIFSKSAKARPVIAQKINSQTSAHSVTQRFATRMNIIRFFSIACIVWGHSVFILEQHAYTNWYYQALQSVLIQLGKTGTILFFIISGFFLSDKVEGFSIIGYLKYRKYSLILPWFFFMSIAALIQTFQELMLEPKGTVTVYSAFIDAIDYFKGVIFYGAYWFIPVSIISALLLIVLKKHLNKMWLGALLAGITTFYSINLHYSWVSTNHTKAFLGYAFFMWLGIMIKRNIGRADKLINNFSWKLLIPLVSLLFVLACLEGFTLHHTICVDPYASIRFSNILLCLLLFIMLIKTSRMQWMDMFNPQANVYGIYLVHCIIIIAFFPGLSTLINRSSLVANLYVLVAIQVLFYAVVMIVTYAIVMILNDSPLAYLIGRKSPQLREKKQEQPIAEAPDNMSALIGLNS